MGLDLARPEGGPHRSATMNALLADLRFVIRQLLSRPGFSVLAVATLAIGTGASAAMFGIVDRVLLRPLPFPDSGRLVQLCETNESVHSYCVASPPDARDWADASRGLASIGQGRGWPFKMEIGGKHEGVDGGLAEPGLFRTLGVTPLLGRLILPGDVTAGSRHVVVLSHALWTTRFGGDTAALGSSLRLDREQYQIVRVLRPGLEVPHLEEAALWVPFPFHPRDEANRKWRGFMTIGWRRCSPGSPSAIRRPTGAGARASCPSSTAWSVRSGRCCSRSSARWRSCC